MTNYINKINEKNSISLKKKFDNSKIINELDSAKNDLENLNEKLKENEHKRKVFMNNNNMFDCTYNLNENLDCFVRNNDNNDIICCDKIGRFDFQRKI